MKPASTLARRLFPLAILLLSTPFLSAAGPILNPGYLGGTASLQGWDFHSSYIYLGDNSDRFESSRTFTGPAYTLVTEGGQDYNLLFLQHSFPRGRFELRSTHRLHVPVSRGPEDILTLNMSPPSGTLVHKVHVTGGTLAASRFQAASSTVDRLESYWAEVDADGAQEVKLPMAEGASIEIQGQVTLKVDRPGGLPPCTIERALPTRRVALRAAEELLVEYPLDLSPDDCAATEVRGTVKLTHPSVNFTSANVWLSGPSDKNVTLDPVAPEFRFTGVSAGTYSLSTQVYFDTLLNGGRLKGSLYLPNGAHNGFSLRDDEVAVRNFGFEGVEVTGGVGFVHGLAPSLYTPQRVSFEGVYQNELPNNGPTAGGNASFEFKAANDTTYQALLTPGKWRRSWVNGTYTVFKANGHIDYRIHLSFIPDYEDTLIDVAAGGPLRLPTYQIVTSPPGDIRFDVKEQPGQPQKNISYPVIVATKDIPRSPTSPSLRVSITSLSRGGSAVEKPQPSVQVVGPPGNDYHIDAYATIDGAYVHFASSVYMIGAPMAAEVGSQVQAPLLDGAGAPLPVSLLFETVTQAGAVSASLADIGPQPSEAFELLPIAKDSRYITFQSSAVFTGNVTLSLSYDPVSLGLSPEEEARLQLLQFVCEGEAEENCQWVRISHPGLQLGASLLSANANPDLSRHIVTGHTPTLGTVVLALPKAEAPKVECVGTEQAPLRHDLLPSTCGLQVDASNGLAGHCTEGGFALASCTFDGSTSKVFGSGKHAVAVRATGTDGQVASCTSYLNLVASGQPTLTLHEDAELTLECNGSPYVDPGAHAVDRCGSALEVHRFNSGSDAHGPGPNTSVEGTYSVQYIAWATSGETASALRTVRVEDHVAPALKLRGPEHMSHPCGEMWVDPGVEALDACYGDVTATVVTRGYVNGWVQGLYTVNYRVTDSGGNSAVPVTRTVEVVGCPW
ncbi:DUF5011 domain-containing protein [Stigmatella erecta]|uniref:Pesticidal crystal protein Cry22Aa Ig-like domain-containing protein n=1 Tax=Stigmatella erecta TaxID=83460 RepID=A0A1I0LGY7_9BACT|nr:DUF5011 domain-containing protein [Stigmatella erecta]SEU38833.1 protein of unknown function [Stigmatella erecta]